MSTQTNPTRVGDYELLATIGEGGMGVVHLGRGRDGRRVAVKVLRPHVIGDEEARQRLAREVNSLRLVHSPRVAEIVDADPFGPTPFVATRYVPGLSLHDHVREEGLLSGEDLWHFADLLAQALAAVHAVGVLHRDVKPTNVLMEGRSPVLIDFGLARLSEDPRLTHTGWLLGTPGYLAPELLYGDEATPAADVHAWAATVVFAAKGVSPYGKGPAMAVLDRVRLGQTDLTGVPQDLIGLLGAALATEPTDRPSIAGVQAWLGSRGPTSPHREAQPAPAMTMPVVTLPREAEPVVPLQAPAATDAALIPAPASGSTSVPAAPTVPTPTFAAPVIPVTASRGQARVLLAGLAALTAGVVAFAPYAGLMLVGLVVLGLRTASIAGERHAMRRLLRGQRRWYDGPRTALSTPGYAVLALFGSLAAVAWGVGAAIAAGVVGHVATLPSQITMLAMGLTFAVALWWGPGSTRVRAVTRRGVWSIGRGGWPGWAAGVAALLLAGVLVSTLLSQGPTWSPATSAPWSQGFLADVLSHL